MIPPLQEIEAGDHKFEASLGNSDYLKIKNIRCVYRFIVPSDGEKRERDYKQLELAIVMISSYMPGTVSARSVEQNLVSRFI